MKRTVSVLLLCAFLCACFHGAPAENTIYTHMNCRCGLENCVCFMQEGDSGPAVRECIALLKKHGCLAEEHSQTVFDAAVTQAVISFQAEMGFEQNGMLDDPTLTCLLHGVTREMLDSDGVSGDLTEVWISSRGGVRCHIRKSCRGMKNARKLTARNAEALGIEKCRVCYGRHW